MKDVLQELIAIMERLRDAKTGCPWDIAQTLSSIVPHTIEEAYEVQDAIYREDDSGLKDELADLFHQILFYTQITKEQAKFNLEDVLIHLRDKLIYRHPHVFSDVQYSSEEERRTAWEKSKLTENVLSNPNLEPNLNSIPKNFPSLTMAQKIGKKVAFVGFDWPNIPAIFDKIEEEVQELKDEIAQCPCPKCMLKVNQDLSCEDKVACRIQTNTQRIEEEFGDLLFAITNLARHLNIDAESALKKANFKFIRRFEHLKELASQDNQLVSHLSMDKLNALWDLVKSLEK